MNMSTQKRSFMIERSYRAITILVKKGRFPKVEARQASSKGIISKQSLARF